MAELSEYEKQRAARVARNQNLLAQLQVTEAASNLAAVVHATSGLVETPPLAASPLDGPVRRSQRIQRAEAEGQRPSLAEPSSRESLEDEDSSDEDVQLERVPLSPKERGKDDEEEYRPEMEASGSEADEEDVEEADKKLKGKKTDGCGRELELDRGGQEAAFQAMADAQADLVARAAAAAGNCEVDEDELALQQAMALSMEGLTTMHEAKSDGVAAQGVPPPSASPANLPHTGDSIIRAAERVGPKRSSGTGRVIRKNASSKKRKVAPSDLLSLDDVASFFHLFDERGRGSILSSDVQRLAAAHDLHWDKEELQDMLGLFGSGSGKLSMEDFEAVVGHCGLLAKVA